MSAAPEVADGDLDRGVALQVEAAALEDLLERLGRTGRIGTPSPAGDARVAMVATGLAASDRDLLLGTARDVPAALARGVGVEAILRQAFAVSGDPALGRGMPGALQDREHGVALTDGSPAAHLVHAAGFGHAARLRGDDRVAFALFGSGAQANGEIHAGLNFAAVYRAQAVFVARGPLADEVPFEEAGEAWGIRVEAVPGDDGVAILEAVREARARAVAGEGPTVVDARLAGEAEPVDVRALQAAGRWTVDHQHHVDEDIRKRLAAARAAAEAAQPIEDDTLTEAVFADRPWFLTDPGDTEAPA
ncbi:MAG: thiamine pyrophosphate-dependent enzyme [Myxococcota bacterium]